MMQLHHERQFRRQVDQALTTVRKILDLTRTPRYADEEDHTYDDKFGLAEFLTNSAMAAQVNAFVRLGLDETKLRRLVSFVHDDQRSVTLRFDEQQVSCSFLEEKMVEVCPQEMSVEVETTSTTTNLKERKVSKQRKVTTKVKEFHWKVGIEYTLFAFAGNDPDSDPVLLQSRASSTTIIANGDKKAPVLDQPVRLLRADISLTWMLQNLSRDDLLCNFQIDRSVESCRTPRRNNEINKALEHFDNVVRWCNDVHLVFVKIIEHRILGELAGSSLSKSSLRTINADGVFVPVLPLMEKCDEGKTKEEDTVSSNAIVSCGKVSDQPSPLLSIGDLNHFLNEQCRSLDEATASIKKLYPGSRDKGKLLSSVEAIIVLVCLHTRDIANHYINGVAYIEQMLQDQMVAAIGKVVQPKDFEDFVRFHNQKLFNPKFAPRPFCYAIRRPNHYPDGVLSIESNEKSIETIVRKISDGSAPPMFFPIDAATSVEFTGDRYVHAWIQHRFASSPVSNYKLIARARQFSSFLLMVGSIAGPDKFEPTNAIILQNKDEVLIPLLLNELPTAKDFKDAISSLSPEQQQFAQSFRGMQLESSVFAVCVIQLKPQLELLLGLPPGALTKEIGLTQDLLSMFIEYQIPSDMLSFDGPLELAVSEKLNAVKGYVKSVQEVIVDAKTKQLEEEAQRADMREEVQFMDPMASSQKRSLRKSSVGVRSVEMCETGSGPIHFKSLDKCISRDQVSAVIDSILPESTDEDATTSEILGCRQDMQVVDNASMSSTGDLVDYTAIPKILDAVFEKEDKDNALHTTKIKLGDIWERKRQKNLLTKATRDRLFEHEKKTEKDKAFDLLDGISRSGSLPIACAELHVVLGVTHCFEKNVMGTAIEENINPIEKVDHSALMIASAIHNIDVQELVADRLPDVSIVVPSRIA